MTKTSEPEIIFHELVHGGVTGFLTRSGEVDFEEEERLAARNRRPTPERPVEIITHELTHKADIGSRARIEEIDFEG